MDSQAEDAAREFYPDYMRQSMCAYDGDFMESRSDLRAAFLAGVVFRGAK